MNASNSQKSCIKKSSNIDEDLVHRNSNILSHNELNQLDVLLIEDNLGDARLIQRMLSKRIKKCEIIHVQRISDALSKLSSRTFDIILLDLGLPDSTGIKSISSIRETSKFTPVIVLTGFDDEELGIRALKLGAQDYLLKGDVSSKPLFRSIRYAMERKRTEIKLRESQEKFRSLIYNIPDVTWIANSEGQMTYISPNVYVMLGFLSEDFINTTRLFFFDRINPNDRQKVIKSYNNLLKTGLPYNIEYRFQREDGKWIWVNEKASMTEGTVNQYIGILTDITINKRAEKDLKEAKDKYQMLVEQLEEGVILIDDKNTITFCNRKAADIFEYKEEELLGKSSDLVVPKSAKTKIEEETRKRKKGIISTYEVDLVTKTGKMISARITSSPVYVEKKYNGSLSIISDITEHKRMQQHLEREKTISEAIIKSLPGQFLFYTEEREKYSLNRWNTLLEDLKGLPPDKLNGYDILKDIHAEDKEKALDAIREAEIKGFSRTELRILDRDKEYHHYLCNTSSFLLDKQRFYVGFSIDINEKKRMAEALRRDEERSRKLLELTHKKLKSRKELLKFALEACVEMTKSKIGYLHLYNSSEGELKLFTWSEKVLKTCSTSKNHHYPLENAGIWADCIRANKPMIHNNYESNPHKKGLPEGHVSINRHMSVPILDGDQVVAVVGVGNKIEPYNQSDTQQLVLFMNDMWRILEQQHAEEELRINEHRLAMSLEASGAGIYEHSIPLDENTYYNDRWLEILGYNRQEMPKSIDFFDWMCTIVHPEDRSKVNQAHQRFITDPQAEYDVEVRIQHKRGHWIYVRGLANATQRNADGLATHIVGVMLDITEKKQAELDLAKSERFNRGLVEGSPIGILFIDANGIITYENPSMMHIMGVPEGGKSPVLGLDVGNIPEIKELGFSNIIRDLFDGKTPSPQLVQAKTILGEETVLEVYGASLKDSSDELEGVILMAQDVTETKRAQADVKRSEEKFRSIFQESPIGITLFDAEGSFIQANNALYETIFDIANPEGVKHVNLFDLPSITEDLKDQLLKGRTIRNVVRIDFDEMKKQKIEVYSSSRRTGVIYLNQIFTPLHDKTKDMPVGYLAHINDITEQKTAELFLQEARDILKAQVEERTNDLHTEKQRIETIIETIPDGIAVIDNHGDFYLVNKVFKDIFSNIFDDISPSFTSMGNLTLLANIFSDTIFTLYHKQQEDIKTIEPLKGLHLQLAAAPVNIPSNEGPYQGSKRGMIISVRDVTPFVELDNLRKHFVSTVSHELRTPITAINLSLKNLQQFGDKISKDQHSSIINMTYESAQILSQMIEDLLIASRVEAGKITLDPVTFNLNEEIQKVLRSLDTKRSAKSLNYQINIDPQIQLVADKKRISQVLRILVDNALKYSEKNSSVIVSAIDSYQGVYNIDNVPGALFQITDSGRGISEEDIPHLFERFFRSKEVKDLSGSGLGLNIAKEIVDLHSGHIFVRSSLEKGSTFTVFIPNQVEPSSR